MELSIWIVLIPVVVIVLLLVVRGGEKKETYSYAVLPGFLSPAERSFFGVLIMAVDDSAEIFSKVRVADVLKPQKGLSRSNWRRALNRISSKHFDFVLCKKDDLSVICVVELNDSSHNTKKCQARDKFLKEACESASLPLIEIPAKRNYSVGDIREKLSLT